MMNVHEQRMCELQADFFELSSDRFSCGSSFFIARFMNSDTAKELDNIDDPYNYISPNNLVSIMSNKYTSLFKKSGVKYPKAVLRWIGYIYRAYVIITKIESSTIYKDIKADKLLALYDSYHTFSPEYCVSRLREMVDEIRPKRDIYEIFKIVMEEDNKTSS